MPREQFLEVAEALCANSGRERTSAFVYAVGWTQHTVGVQYIRTAAIIQLLLGNIGRPGGGIMALRGHASIQGSTDIPTLYNILPGYIPMPHAARARDARRTSSSMNARRAGFWGHMDAYIVSLLKAWWGDAATADNDFCFDYLPRIDRRPLRPTRRCSTCSTARCKGFFLLGENPAVGSAQLAACTGWRWPSSTGWSCATSGDRDAPRSGTTRPRSRPASCAPRRSGPRSSSCRPPRTPRRTAASPTPSACCSGTTRRSSRRATAARELWFIYHLGRRIREKLAGSTDPTRPAVLDLTWDYPTDGRARRPERRGGAARDQRRRTPNGTGRCPATPS